MADKNLIHTVDELNLSEDIKTAIKMEINSNLEDLLSFMIGMPTASKRYLTDIGANYDDIKKQIYDILPEDKRKTMEKYEKKPFQRGFGALPPKKNK